MTLLQRSALAFTLILVFNAPHTAYAQASIYGSIDATDYGFSSNASGNLNYSPDGSSSSFLGDSFGLEGGGTYLFHSQSRLKAGLDLRELYSFGSKGGNAGFASLRFAFVPRHNPLSPYLQLGGGYIHTPLPGGEYVVSDANGNILHVVHQSGVTGGAADFLFGLNVRAGARWTVRAIEFGGYAGAHVALSTVGAGIVYTLPSLGHS